MTCFLEIIITSLFTSGVLGFIFKMWIVEKIKQSIKFEHDKQLEAYKRLLLNREKAEIVAELLSEWMESSHIKDQEKRHLNIKRMNTLAYQCYLWLPKDIATELTKLLAHHPEASDSKEILAAVRKTLLGSEEALTAEAIVHFPYEG